MHSKGNAIVGDGASALQMKGPARAPPSDEHLLASPTAVAARARVEAGRRSGSVVEEEAGTTGKRENEEGSGSWEKMSKICDGGV